MTNPNIPDSVSPDMLRALLGKGMPDSEAIPRLNFGGDVGGPCDLQFAVSQLVARSTGGVNFVQILIAAMHLLTEVQLHLDGQLDEIKSGKVDFSDTSEAVQKEIHSEMKRQCAAINSAAMHVEQIVTAMAPAVCAMRVQSLIQRGVIKPGAITPDDFNSQLIISDELVHGLGLDRNQVTAFIAEQAP